METEYKIGDEVGICEPRYTGEKFKVLGWCNIDVYVEYQNGRSAFFVARDKVMPWMEYVTAYLATKAINNTLEISIPDISLSSTGIAPNNLYNMETEYLNNKINNNKNMGTEFNLLDLANQVALQEPDKTLQSLGFTDQKNKLTNDGIKLFLQYLFELNKDTFIETVVKPIKDYQDEQTKKNK